MINGLYRSFRFVLLSLLCLISVSNLAAQTSGAALIGRVIDSTGAVLPGVTVSVTNAETGLSRIAVTSSDGTYRFPALPVGTYSVTAELSGFATSSLKNVRLNVASERDLDITLGQAALSEAITVSVDAPLIATSPAVGTVVSKQELENLPLNGRQFASLGSLAPGTSLSVNGDPTKPGQQTIALNGGSGRNVNFVIDGGDNTDDTIGGALQNFNLEAVEEFKIQTMQYKAEYGRSSGGVLSVVTKTGTNNFGGSLYGFFRDKSLNEETESESLAGAGKQDYERQQYGASLGGPIVRDRAHFFATYEKTDRKTNYIVGTGGIFPDLDGAVVPVPFLDELVTAKATLNASPKQYLQVRYGYQKNSDKYGQGSQTTPNALGTVSNEYKSILGGHNWQLGASALNEFVFQWTRFNNAITPDSTVPYLLFPGGVTFGQNFNTPQTTNQEKSQFKDDFSWSQPLFGVNNNFKTGFNYIHEPILGGDFSTGLAGQFTMLEDTPNSPVVDILFNGGFSGNTTPVDQYSAYFQDDIILSDRLTINTGLRYDYWAGFDLDQSSNPIYQDFHTQTRFNDFYFEEFRNGEAEKLENDTNNWGPRLGFAWDLKGDSRQILRGGWGIYYDFPYTNATILFPASAVQSNYGTIYNVSNPTGIRNPDGSFFRPGQPLPPNQLPSADVPPPIEIASSTLATPFSRQASLGYSFEATSWLGVNIEAVSIAYRDIPFRFRVNTREDTNGDGVRDTLRFPAYGRNLRLWYGDGEADYEGVNIGARARVAQKFEMQGFYTWSKADGNIISGADEFRLWNAGFQPDAAGARDRSVCPHDPFCSAQYGPLNTDARHRVTMSALYQAPFQIHVSGVFRYNSALPYTRLGGDLNGDGFASDLAPGVDHVNSGRGEAFSQLDLRLSKEFPLVSDFSVELIGELFNVFNDTNPALFNRTGQPTAYAGDPLQGEQRLIQLGARIRY